jgi:peptide/nickel transport system permease protein
VLAELCTRAVVMYAGQVVEQAGLGALLALPAHPYTAGLLRSDPRHAAPGVPLPVLEGSVPAPADWPVGCHFHDRCPLVTASCAAGPIPITTLRSERETRCLRHAELIGGRP